MTVNWTNAPESIEDLFGFVYEITNLTNDKRYIGQKQFWSRRTLPPLKGMKRKRKKVVESDWKVYTGSSESLNLDISNGDKIVKKILRICNSKFELNYFELKEQMEREVLFKEEYYNGIINVRISRPPKLLLEQWKKENKFN